MKHFQDRGSLNSRKKKDKWKRWEKLSVNWETHEINMSSKISGVTIEEEHSSRYSSDVSSLKVPKNVLLSERGEQVTPFSEHHKI